MFNHNRSNKDKFARVISELNKSAELKEPLKPSSEISLFGRSSIGLSQRSTKYTHNNTINFKPMILTQEQAIQIFLNKYQVIVNRNRTFIKTQFVPTLKGLKYLLIIGQTGQKQYVNLSWVHSAQQLEKNKILILYYSLQKIKIKEKPNIQSLVIQFSQQKQLSTFLSAVLYIHEKFHDEDVEKIYHQFCSQQQ